MVEAKSDLFGNLGLVLHQALLDDRSVKVFVAQVGRIDHGQIAWRLAVSMAQGVSIPYTVGVEPRVVADLLGNHPVAGCNPIYLWIFQRDIDAEDGRRVLRKALGAWQMPQVVYQSQSHRSVGSLADVGSSDLAVSGFEAPDRGLGCGQMVQRAGADTDLERAVLQASLAGMISDRLWSYLDDEPGL